MKLSEQLRRDHKSGDFGNALEGYAERAEALEIANNILWGKELYYMALKSIKDKQKNNQGNG